MKQRSTNRTSNPQHNLGPFDMDPKKSKSNRGTRRTARGGADRSNEATIRASYARGGPGGVE